MGELLHLQLTRFEASDSFFDFLVIVVLGVIPEVLESLRGLEAVGVYWGQPDVLEADKCCVENSVPGRGLQRRF